MDDAEFDHLRPLTTDEDRFRASKRSMSGPELGQRLSLVQKAIGLSGPALYIATLPDVSTADCLHICGRFGDGSESRLDVSSARRFRPLPRIGGPFDDL